MKNLTRHLLLPVAIIAGALAHTSALAQTTYNQATVTTFNPGNLVEKSATTAPNTFNTFSNLVKEAFTTNSGGVFDFPTAVTTGTTLYRGTYAGATKRLHMTASTSMQNSTASGNTFIPVSGANVTTSSANSADYNLTIGPIFDVATSNIITTEAVG